MTLESEFKIFNDKITEFKDKYSNLCILPNYCYDDDGTNQVNSCKIVLKNFEPEIEINFYHFHELDIFENIIKGDFTFFKSIIGFFNKLEYYLIIEPVSNYGVAAMQAFFFENDKPIDINFKYQEKFILASIVSIDEIEELKVFYKSISGLKSVSPYILKLSCPCNEFFGQNEEDILNVANSILFDLEFSFGISQRIVRTSYFIKDPLTYYKRGKIVPKSILQFTFKKYKNELLEYYYTAEKISYLPFQYLCFYQIVEYFFNKSAYLQSKTEIENIIKLPDFYLYKDKYLAEIINKIQKEFKSSSKDNLKLKRVLIQFIDFNDVVNYLQESSLKTHFENDCRLICEKELILPKIDFTSEQQFYETIHKRIYSLRCSIVHSDPDFEKEYAIPFVPNASNLKSLSIEKELMHYISKKIIINSAEFG